MSVTYGGNIGGGPAAGTGSGVCQVWCTSADVLACGSCNGNTYDSTLIDAMILVASDALFILTGQQFPGTCENIVRPIGVEWAAPFGIGSVGLDGSVYGTGFTTYGPFGQPHWDNLTNRNLGTSTINEIRLPGYPVVSIDQVLIDGAVLATTAYKVNDDRWLSRVDGEYWPLWQDLTKDSTESDTFEVTYSFGEAPPSMGKLAAATMACELLQACTPGGGTCNLPQRVTSLNRQGVSMALLDPQDFLDQGRTGIYLVDLFIKTYNPSQIRERSAGFSPDVNWPVHRFEVTENAP